ncbi:MAG: alpha/beta hydrolase [Byssovorax sp.]
MRSSGLLALAFATAQAACAPVNMLGREIRVDEHPYEFRGERLAYLTGEPAGGSADLPVVIFLEGDGGQCQRFSRRLWERFLTRFTGDYLLVRPRTFINTHCDEPAFTAADFASRADELDVVVRAVRARHAGRPLVLAGHSAGAHVAIAFTRRAPGEVRAVANLGGGVRELGALLPEIEIERAKRGEISAAELAARLRAIDETRKDVAAHQGSSAPFWGRTYRFWGQMFFSGVDAMWESPTVPIFIAHGERDLESVPFSTVEAARARLAGKGGVRFSFYPTLGHDLLTEEVFRDLNAWIQAL